MHADADRVIRDTVCMCVCVCVGGSVCCGIVFRSSVCVCVHVVFV